MKYLIVLINSMLTFSLYAASCPSDVDPGSGLRGYLTAMQNHRFEDAYEFVTDNMTDGKSVTEWATLQQYFYLGGEVIIFGISIRDALALENNAKCLDKALVPNVLRSRDKFNNQGTTEFELYSMVKEGGKWKVDSLEVLFEEEQIKKWFPEDHIPVFHDQHPTKN
ncbi:MAG: hypothetical protein VX986_00070 [Pseudomonadota bacterium]|nr:hypothetical protein [Pseudomonadota bacterium]